MALHHCAACYEDKPHRYQPLDYEERPGTDTTSPAAVYICPQGHVAPFAECLKDPTAPPQQPGA